MKEQRKNMLPALRKGTDRFMEQLVEFSNFYAKNPDDHVFLLRNILLNLAGNIFKTASDCPESFLEKADQFIADFQNWKKTAAAHFHEENVQKSFWNGKEVN